VKKLLKNDDIISSFDNDKNLLLKINLGIIPDVDNLMVITLAGYINAYNCDYFSKQISKVRQNQITKLIFHCSSLNYLSSTGIGAFFSIAKDLQKENGNIILNSLQPKVYEVFKIVGFSKHFIIKNNLEESINYFRENENEPIFPKQFNCPVCKALLKVKKPGKYGCKLCSTIMKIDNYGVISIS